MYLLLLCLQFTPIAVSRSIFCNAITLLEKRFPSLVRETSNALFLAVHQVLTSSLLVSYFRGHNVQFLRYSGAVLIADDLTYSDLCWLTQRLIEKSHSSKTPCWADPILTSL